MSKENSTADVFPDKSKGSHILRVDLNPSITSTSYDPCDSQIRLVLHLFTPFYFFHQSLFSLHCSVQFMFYQISSSLNIELNFATKDVI